MRRWKATLFVCFVALFSVAFGARAQSRPAGAPPPSIHTFSTEDSAEYVEVMVPKKIRHPYPIVFFHGAGQTGTDWLQTPDGRPGWAYFFIKQGYTIYMVDFPARGRSTYNPSPDGDGALTIRTALQLEQIWTDI